MWAKSLKVCRWTREKRMSGTIGVSVSSWKAISPGRTTREVLPSAWRLCCCSATTWKQCGSKCRLWQNTVTVSCFSVDASTFWGLVQRRAAFKSSKQPKLPTTRHFESCTPMRCGQNTTTACICRRCLLPWTASLRCGRWSPNTGTTREPSPPAWLSFWLRKTIIRNSARVWCPACSSDIRRCWRNTPCFQPAVSSSWNHSAQRKWRGQRAWRTVRSPPDCSYRRQRSIKAACSSGLRKLQ